MKDQIGDVLAELMEIKNGLEACGISSDTYEFLDDLIPVFSESQIRKNTEIDVYKYFCDVMISIGTGSKYKLIELSLRL